MRRVTRAASIRGRQRSRGKLSRTDDDAFKPNPYAAGACACLARRFSPSWFGRFRRAPRIRFFRPARGSGSFRRRHGAEQDVSGIRRSGARTPQFCSRRFPAAAYDKLDKIDGSGGDGKARHRRRQARADRARRRQGLSSQRQANDRRRHRYRKWLLVAAVGDLTALVTVQVPEQDTNYPDKAVRDALATLAVRASVPDAERLSLLAVHGRRPGRISHRRCAAGPRPDAGRTSRPAQNNPTRRRTITNKDAAGHSVDARF